MLTASLVAIMVMTLLWWSRYAAEPEMVPVLDQSFTQAEIGLISNDLDAKDVPHTVVGDRVMVPADRKMEVLAQLAYAQALPKNFDNAFDEMVKTSGPFTSPDLSEHMLLHAKEQTLSEVISNFPNVSNALVVIDPTDEHKFDGPSIEPSAMVTITTSRLGDSNSRQLAQAAASAISGAQAGLAMGKINVVVDGVPVNVPDPGSPDGPGGSEILEDHKAYEEFYSEQIQKGLGDIRGLMISVSVNLDTAIHDTVSHKVSSDPKAQSSQVQTSDEQSTETTSPPAGGADPGALANVSVSATGAGGGGGGSTNSDSKTMYENDHSKDDITIHQGPGQATVAAASVRVPRSYFVETFKSENDGKDPDETSLEAFTQTEITKIRQSVKAATNITNDDAVFVNSYIDTQPAMATATSAVTSSPISVVTIHGKEIGVGALAAMSMAMMFMMVRKGAPPMPVPVTPAGSPEPQPLIAGDMVAGQVTEGNPLLDGMELDDDSVKASQMLDQVQQMVTANPDGAASLVKRWLNRT
jgi:flagellar biosynthesis/type III secretory pathway M-ring protein FliF/YscJ